MNSQTTINNSLSKPSNFRWVIVFLLFFINIVNYIDRSAISFALNEIQVMFNLNPIDLGLILGAFGIGYFISTLLGGIIIDKKGPKYIFALIVILWVISMFSMAASMGFMMIFLSRILLGISEGPSFPALEKSLSNWLPEVERATALAYSLVAVPLALAIGGPVVTYLISSFSWRGMFSILGLLALVWLPVWLIFFKNDITQSKFANQDEKDLVKNNLNKSPKKLTGIKALLRYIFIGDINKCSTKIIKSRENNNTWKFLLTNKTLLANYWAYFVFGYFLFFFMGWLPVFLANVYHLNLHEEGFFTMLPWLGGAFFMLSNGRLSDFILCKTSSLRKARTYPIIIFVLLASCSVIPLFFVKHPSLGVAITLVTLAVSFTMGVNANYYAVALDIVKDKVASCLGIMTTVFAIAGFISPTITGYFVDITNSFYGAFALLILLGLSSVVVLFLFHKPDND